MVPAMSVKTLIRPGAYFDSVVLMRVAAELNARPDVNMASLVMGTPANRDVLDAAGLLTDDAAAAGPNDLVVAVDADESALDECLNAAVEALSRGAAPSSGGFEPVQPRTLAQVEGNLALISTPGRYAAAEALKGLRRGMNVFLFSDNVPVDQEHMLKKEARDRGLLVMGPDCGTSIISGVPLGFANVVRRGDIGLVGASGTGLQEISSLIDGWGAGVSHAIGVGSHDLSAQIGAISMNDAIDALAADPETRVLGLVSKPPDPQVAELVLAHAASTGMPVVAAFLGADSDSAPAGATVVPTLEEAARQLVLASSGQQPPATEGADLPSLPAVGDRRLLRALFAGGTFAYEAKVLLEPQIGAVTDDADPPGVGRPARLPDQHLVLDLGDDRFTVGRAHPMIDPAVRLDMLRAAGADPRTAVIVLDVVLGYMSADDPAGDLAPVIAEITAREDAPHVIAFLVGTNGDPQGFERSRKVLLDAGAKLTGSSTAAADLVARSLTVGAAS